MNGLEQVYRTILKAVAPPSDVQLVLSVGRNIDLKDLGPIPPDTIVVRTAPQLELLKRAALCITHAGLNTALEALARGGAYGGDSDRVRPTGRRCQNCVSRSR